MQDLPHDMPLQIDCATCPVRGMRCDGCIVPALLSLSPTVLPPDAVESRALDALVGAGLLSAADAAGAYARREAGPVWASVG